MISVEALNEPVKNLLWSLVSDEKTNRAKDAMTIMARSVTS